MLVTKNEEQIPEMEWLLIFQINLIAIMAMGRLYEYMAEKLTVWGEFKVYDVWSTYLIESTGCYESFWVSCGTFIIQMRQIRLTSKRFQVLPAKQLAAQSF